MDVDNDQTDEKIYEGVKKTVLSSGIASVPYLQEKLDMGYARAARFIDMLEENGVIGKGDYTKPRNVLIKLTSRNNESKS